MAEDAAQWWAAPALHRAWGLIAARLEQAGLVAVGRVSVSDLTRPEQRALSDLLGRTVLADRVRIDLADLDGRLRTRAGVSLVAAAEQTLGRPLADRPAARADRAARRSAPVEFARAWAQEHPHIDQAVIDEWVTGLARDGLLMRDPNPSALVADALRVLNERGDHRPDIPPIARTELAARLRGDAHALDDDRRLSAVILRLVRLHAAMGTDEDAAASGSWPGWECIKVVTDRVSSTCLVLGLVPVRRRDGDRLVSARGPDEPRHLIWRDLDAGLAFAPGQRVLVSENPRVLEAAAELRIDGWGFVSTGGRPSLVTYEVLGRLRAAGALLRYHGDFDWPGISMTNDLVRRFGVEPWRMGVSDYLAVEAQLDLAGPRVDASWDPELAPAMEHRGLAVHEESTLPGILRAL